MIRQPIVSVLGHVDSGKTTLLDSIRGSLVVEREAGNITQMIGATPVPLDTIESICGDLLEDLDTDLTIPGLLFIDTPGHAAFASLRKRGGNLSDIAVLVVDINDGVQPQTREAVRILGESGTPFVIALNKLDTISGWEEKEKRFVRSYGEQKEPIRKRLDEKIYEIMGEFSELGYTVERYDRIDNFTDKVGVVPVSARTGEGIPDLLMVLAGLSQRFLSDRLEVEGDGGEGTVLEVNEVKGLGKTIDVILYDGTIEREDSLVIGGKEGAVVTRIKAILEPRPLSEMGSEKDFERVESVSAAAGVKISAPDLDDVVSGAPVIAAGDEREIEGAVERIESEMEDLERRTGESGVVVRADSIGSLEALMKVLEDNDVPVQKGEVGKVTKKDVIEAENGEGAERAILAFNTTMTDAAERYLDGSTVSYFESDVIYELVESYEEHVEEIERMQRENVLESITRPAKIRLLPDHVFRSSNPAVVGVEIVSGVLNSGSRVMDAEGNALGRIKSIQQEGESIESATKGQEVAVSITNVTVGRQVKEGDELYTDVPGNDYRIMDRMRDSFSQDELRLLEEIEEIKDRRDPRWKLA